MSLKEAFWQPVSVLQQHCCIGTYVLLWLSFSNKRCSPCSWMHVTVGASLEHVGILISRKIRWKHTSVVCHFEKKKKQPKCSFSQTEETSRSSYSFEKQITVYKKVHSFQTHVWTLYQWMCLASGYVSVRARKNYISFVLTHFWVHCKLLENLIKHLEIWYHDFLRARACVHMCARACIAFSIYCPLSRTSAKNKTAFALCYKVLNDLPLKLILEIFYSQLVASRVV